MIVSESSLGRMHLPAPNSDPHAMPAQDSVRLRASLWLGFILVTSSVVLPGSKALSQSGEVGSTASGVSYRNDRIRSVPWSVHVVKIDRSRKDLVFFAPLARGTVLGVSTLTEMARSVPRSMGRPVAGVNGDFYERDNRYYAGDPRGLQIVNGELVSAPSTVSVWFDPDGNPHLGEVKADFKVTWPDGRVSPFGLNHQRRPNGAVLYTAAYGPTTRAKGGREYILEKHGDGAWLPLQTGKIYRARVREIREAGDSPLTNGIMVISLGPQLATSVADVAVGSVVEISTTTTPDLNGVETAVSGGPALISKGKPFALRSPPAGTSEGYSERSKYERHPRAAAGWNDKFFFLVEVDGRQPQLSVGMTLAELADYMVKLGCTEGINFDGGNSATMWVLGQVVNSPCQGEKPVANALIVVRRDAASGR